MVVNLFEGTADNNASELYAAGILEWLGVPYTGCPFPSLVLARSKHLAKRLFQAEGLPTAPFFVTDGPVPACPLRFPVIVKPAQQDASVGVTQNSVVTDLDGLNRQVSYLVEQFGQPALVEEFIRGREVTFALVEMPDLRFLPATEALFPDAGPNYWPILTYDAKWTARVQRVRDDRLSLQGQPARRAGGAAGGLLPAGLPRARLPGLRPGRFPPPRRR